MLETNRGMFVFKGTRKEFEELMDKIKSDDRVTFTDEIFYELGMEDVVSFVENEFDLRGVEISQEKQNRIVEKLFDRLKNKFHLEYVDEIIEDDIEYVLQEELDEDTLVEMGYDYLC